MRRLDKLEIQNIAGANISFGSEERGIRITVTGDSSYTYHAYTYYASHVVGPFVYGSKVVFEGNQGYFQTVGNEQVSVRPSVPNDIHPQPGSVYVIYM